MRVDAFLEQLRLLPFGSLDDITDGQPFVVLSPHPDDESLGMGGLISAACARNQTVDVVLITDGAGSHPNSRTYPKDKLVRLRQFEIEAAGSALGLPAGRLTHLGLPDTQAPTSGPSFETAVACIDTVVSTSGARTLFVTWKYDPHCDHEATAHMAMAVLARHPDLKLWSYPIWGWHRNAEDLIDAPPPVGYRFDIAPWRHRKQEAIAAHRSQMTDLIADDPQGFRFTPETLRPFLGPSEYFIEVPV